MFIIEDYALENPNQHKPSDTLETLNLEFHYQVTRTLVAAVAYLASKCRGDFDGDKDVDGFDLKAFAADFGRTDCNLENPCEGDFDGDNNVDTADFAVFSTDFGRTDCP
ncbi:MAG: hypothetical protein JW786_01485 [Desulfobacterales bacterium]|nr:hypothetical protein [Desulfobacterales bacterium]